MKRKNNKKWDFAISLGLVNLQGGGDRENFTITALFWVLQSQCIGAKFYNFDVTSGPADRTNLNKKRGGKANTTSMLLQPSRIRKIRVKGRKKKVKTLLFCIISSPVYS